MNTDEHLRNREIQRTRLITFAQLYLAWMNDEVAGLSAPAPYYSWTTYLKAVAEAALDLIPPVSADGWARLDCMDRDHVQIAAHACTGASMSDDEEILRQLRRLLADIKRDSRTLDDQPFTPLGVGTIAGRILGNIYIVASLLAAHLESHE